VNVEDFEPIAQDEASLLFPSIAEVSRVPFLFCGIYCYSGLELAQIYFDGYKFEDYANKFFGIRKNQLYLIVAMDNGEIAECLLWDEVTKRFKDMLTG
jgi:hypothetical protein